MQFCRAPVNSVVGKSMILTTAIIDITFSRFSFVFSQCYKVSTSPSNVVRLAVGARDLSVIRLVLVCYVG